jgi:hypothetical protein
MSTQGIAREVLAKAATKLGGVGVLARQLGVREGVVRRYLDGHQAVPDPVFLRALDLIEGDPSVVSPSSTLTPKREPPPSG